MTAVHFNSPKDLITRAGKMLASADRSCPIECLQQLAGDILKWDRNDCAAFNTICLASLLECNCSIELVVARAPKEDVMRVMRRAFTMATPTVLPARDN